MYYPRAMSECRLGYFRVSGISQISLLLIFAPSCIVKA